MNKDNRLKSISLYSKLWDSSGSINRTRAQGEPFNVVNKRLAMHLMAQPLVSQSLLADEMCIQQGFLARFLMAFPKSRIGERPLGEYNAQHIDIVQFYEMVQKCLNSPLKIKQGTLNDLDVPTLRLSPAAKTLLEEFYDETEAAQKDDALYADIRSHASKATEQACRIAGCLSVFAKPENQLLSVDVMGDAIALMRWYLAEAMRIYNNSCTENEFATVYAIQKWLCLQHSRGLEYTSLRHLLQYAPRSLRHKDILVNAIEVLIDYGMLRRENTPQMIKGKLSHQPLLITENILTILKT